MVARLALEYGVVVIPGSACGAKGHVRISYANLVPEKCQIAADKLNKGLREIVSEYRSNKNGDR